jgi:uncharacterized DUF497 family protein
LNRYLYDGDKNRANKLKHDVTFAEAESVFDDFNAVYFFDPEHSVTEDRWIVIGLSKRLRVLFVVHTRLEESLIRIISARRATPDEEQLYAANLQSNP